MVTMVIIRIIILVINNNSNDENSSNSIRGNSYKHDYNNDKGHIKYFRSTYLLVVYLVVRQVDLLAALKAYQQAVLMADQWADQWDVKQAVVTAVPKAVHQVCQWVVQQAVLLVDQQVGYRKIIELVKITVSVESYYFKNKEQYYKSRDITMIIMYIFKDMLRQQ